MKLNKLFSIYLASFITLTILVFPFNVLAVNYGEGGYGLGNYNEGEPTPTPTPNATSTSSNSNSTSSNDSSASTSTPTCNDLAPLKPELFQVDIKGTSAKLFFTPLQVTNIFYISYSTNSNAEGNGVEVTLAREGVQNYTVNALKPYSNYYFKVRGQNNCKSGEWSNIVKVNVRSAGLKNTISYYMNSLKTKATSAFSTVNLPKVKNSIPKNVGKTSTIEVTSAPKEADKQETVKQPEKKKTCILWWCW